MSTVDNFERGATRFSSTVAALVAVLVGLGLGIATDATAEVLGILAGAVLVALGVRALQRESNDRRAAGSLGVVVGTVAFAVAALFGQAVAVLVGLAVAAVVVNATVNLDEAVARPLRQTTWRSATVLAVGAVLAIGLHANVFTTSTGLLTTGIVEIVTTHDLARLVALQVEILAVGELLFWTVPILNRWLPADSDVRATMLDRVDFRVENVSRIYWAFLGGQFVLAMTTWGPRWFAGFLGVLGPLGDAIQWLLHSGVLHLPVAAVLLALIAVLVGRVIQWLFVGWAGSSPPRTLAHSTGGVAVVALTAVLALPIFAGPVTDTLSQAGWGNTVAALGTSGTLLGVVAATLFAVAILRTLVFRVVGPWVATDAAGGFAVGAALLFVAALVAAEVGAAPLAVFAAVAGALVVHDLGGNAAELGSQVGRVAETRTGEVAHTVGGLAVAAVGVVLAAASAYVLGPISTAAVPAWRARLALALVLVAVVAFVALIKE